MRSKTIVWAYLVILSLGTIMSLYIPKNEVAAKEEIVIPGEAIRLRILANSDSVADQALKRMVRDKVNENITLWVKDLTSIDDTRNVIQSKLPQIQEIAEKVVREQQSTQTVNVKFGKVQFPTKLYGEFLYPAGEYEAILITLGEGKGANWWCVLYPPLCFLDFSNGVAVSKGFESGKKEEQENKELSLEKKVYAAEQHEDNEQPAAETEQIHKANDTKKIVSQEETKEEIKKADSLVEDNAIPETSKKHGYIGENHPEENNQEKAKLYTEEDEKPVEVKFFVVEIWHKLFN